MASERMRTGIAGLDEKMEGGYVPGSVYLVAGKSGTGKTQFCSSFLYAGAINGEVCLYITTEERVEDIHADILAMFNWDFASLEKKGLLYFLNIKPTLPEKEAGDVTKIIKAYVNAVTGKILEAIKKVQASRVVIDSISIIELFIEDKYMARVALLNLLERLRELGVTAVLSGEVPETSEGLSGSGIIEFLVDGVIRLDFVPVSEEFKRTLTIRKMRRTNHSTLIHPFEITKSGIRLVNLE